MPITSDREKSARLLEEARGIVERLAAAEGKSFQIDLDPTKPLYHPVIASGGTTYAPFFPDCDASLILIITDEGIDNAG